MEYTSSNLGPHLSQLPNELILEIANIVCSSSQKGYLTLLLVCQKFYHLCRATCLPVVPIVLNDPNTISLFSDFLDSDEQVIAPRVRRLWIRGHDDHNIIKRCTRVVSLACDGHDLIPICSGHETSSVSTFPTPSQQQQQQQSPCPQITRTTSATPHANDAPSTIFRHTHIRDLTIMGLWDFWPGFLKAPFAPVLCSQVRRLWLLDHLFLYRINATWLSSLTHLAIGTYARSIEEFAGEMRVLNNWPGLEKLLVVVHHPGEGVLRGAERVGEEGEEKRMWVMTWPCGSSVRAVDVWMERSLWD